MALKALAARAFSGLKPSASMTVSNPGGLVPVRNSASPPSARVNSVFRPNQGGGVMDLSSDRAFARAGGADQQNTARFLQIDRGGGQALGQRQGQSAASALTSGEIGGLAHQGMAPGLRAGDGASWPRPGYGAGRRAGRRADCRRSFRCRAVGAIAPDSRPDPGCAAAPRRGFRSGSSPRSGGGSAR